MSYYHLIGICGTAMASLAGMLVKRGHQVTGSDENIYPPMSTQLADLGISVRLGYSPQNFLHQPDVVVVGNAIPRGNPEVEHVLDKKWYYTSMAEVLKQEYLRNKTVLVVTGTHGKTTTTALEAWICNVAGLNPSFLIGGVSENLGTSFCVADSNYFVIEGDEYDTAYFDKGPKFMHYLPEIAILGNIEFDHADIYSSLDAIKIAFQRFINLIPRSGTLISWFGSPLVKEISLKSFCPVESFAIEGNEGEALWIARDLQYISEGMTFSLFYKNKKVADFTTPLFGEFNVRNVVASIIGANHLGISIEKIQEAIQTFKSVRRRMQILGKVNEITIIDDFAHHPTAVRETLEAINHRYKGHRIITIFEPRSWSSRKKIFQQQYEEAFDMAAKVIIAPVFESFKLQTEDQFSPEHLVNVLRKKGIVSDVIDGIDNIIDHVAPDLASGDIVVIMSNGGFGKIHDRLLARLQSKNLTHGKLAS